ncbi:phosphoenolpyruvate synthase [Chitinophaga alhagiae]|uniref:phosphoenolpyruvate synthase n=1 Tax=Chitinophaga alhagiae TaxID=2203219 RepID=UPI000E5C5251|nr:phosphoenolpyruvate synthase [Chitinophaga alhagiae]
MSAFIKKFSDISLKDINTVGGKNASLGEMVSGLQRSGIRVPEGFAVTTAAFRAFMEENTLQDCYALLQELDRQTYANLHQVGMAIRQRMLQGVLSAAMAADIGNAYEELCNGEPQPMAVRSSATAEDLPAASFAGQHDSFLHITGKEQVLDAVRRCFASLFTDRAIKYREEREINHAEVAISVGIQRMINADEGSSGVVFSLEPDSGCREVMLITGCWGLGENIVQGTVQPDEYYVFKPGLLQGKEAVIRRKTGEKETTMRYDPGSGNLRRDVTAPARRKMRVLTEPEVVQLAHWSLAIETHYRQPMDIEWAKDGITGELFILQARPETVFAQRQGPATTTQRLLKKGPVLVQGEAVGSGIAAETARLLASPLEASALLPGDIIVTTNTSPDWDPLLQKAGGIVTNTGGRTSHAAIVAREMGVPAIVGTTNATERIHNGQPVTISCSEGKTGFVYEGMLPVETETITAEAQQMPGNTKVMLILSDPDRAFRLAGLPNDGVGLLRLEFMITHTVKIHPMALVNYDELANKDAKAEIDRLTAGYASREEYFIETLASGIATVAAAFYPKDVIVRMSDFKTNEYAMLIGGAAFEPHEENPMLGFRGASRYYHPLYKEGFGLECKAVKKVRNNMGLTNVKVMVPFCRTVPEGREVLKVMKEYGLERNQNGLEVYVMAELPSNVLCAAGFAEIFDGFSIGSNDLTQLVLGIDRDSAILSGAYSEEDPACQLMVDQLISAAAAAGVPAGFCGQAPSDIPGYAEFLVSRNISSISFSPDTLLQGLSRVRAAEKQVTGQ